jgi:hypothetical protein
LAQGLQHSGTTTQPVAPHGWDAIKKFYGWDKFVRRYPTPNALKAALPKEWEPQLVLVRAPAGVSFYFDRDGDGMRDAGEDMRGIRVHALAAPSLERVLVEVRDAGLWRFVECCSGGYAFRLQRNSFEKVSMHALAAVDFDAEENAQGVDPAETQLGSPEGLRVVRIFQKHGWTWGGGFSNPDAMHFQFGSGY